MIRSNLLDETVGDVLSTGIEGADDGLFLINPSRDTIRDLVEVLGDADNPPHVRLFAAEGPLKALMDDFLVASAVADHIDAGTLSVRTLESVPNAAFLVSAESVISLVVTPDRAGGLATIDAAFVETTADHYEKRWSTAPEFTLRTPPRSEVMETLESDIGPGAARDFEAVLDSLESARGDGDGLDEVTISLLVAARNGELLYDISKWGEDVGLASKATFSRTKTQLEEQGLLGTEKVPIDVGRPRLRLLFADDRLDEADIEELAGVAQELMA